ncbi:hypothetical protein GALMADRAFT_252009 [Galerina marginata CBS 339.88]|uniref:Uncharacterized protein n=1 Tax=Galerina marginata (strain CBS 339.88) TaxID=685588 RepID=A0A067T2Z8_GALM3|nr:hypothetical protein GALMADRAFT_252009 [Galerina marginata CBS 339.88]
MYSTTRRISILSLLTLTSVLAQEHNVTVPDTSPFITYTGQGTGNAAICKLDPNGNLAGAQPGCYFIPDQCTSTVAMSQNLDHKASASFQFNGSAIFINSVLSDVSPVYTVTLDGNTTDVDGVRPSRNFTCAPLFSQTGLDPTVQHTIKLAVKGPSPTRNTTQDPNGTLGVFSLIEFIFTNPGPTNSTSANSTSSGPSTASRMNSASKTELTPGSVTPIQFNGAPVLLNQMPSMLLSGVLALGVWTILEGFAL